MYKVGDRVRIRGDLVDDPYKYPPVGINDTMVALAESDATIIECGHRDDGVGRIYMTYRLDIDNGRYTWTDQMLIPAIRRSSKELYEVWRCNSEI